MAAVFGAASRATFAFIVFAFEITRDYNAILPLMLGCVIADMIAIRFLPSSIMTEKLARRGHSVPHEYEASILKVVRVGEVMQKDVQPLLPEMSVGEVAERMALGDPVFNLTQGLPIVDNNGHLVGVVTQGDLLRSLEIDPTGQTTVVDAGGNRPIVAYADELLRDALFRMLQYDIGRLPVVTREHQNQMIGYLNRAHILSAWTRQIEDESFREHGWLRQIWRPEIRIQSSRK
jgi:CBS domain-containing protein